ncbi:hypothetical protein ACFX2C_022036 [Malus domestica]
MLRDCIRFPALAKYILEPASFELFFKYVELPNFDVASDAFFTFKDPLTKHGTMVSEFLTAHYDELFDLYEKLLTSPNYVTRRQSLKDSSKNIQISAFHIFKVFVANPNKPQEVKLILAKNHEKLTDLLQNLFAGKGDEDEQFEEEKELIIKEIERVCHFMEILFVALFDQTPPEWRVVHDDDCEVNFKTSLLLEVAYYLWNMILRVRSIALLPQVMIDLDI